MFYEISFFGVLQRLLYKILFELLYPIYLLKFGNEKKYIEERLRKADLFARSFACSANLKITAREVYKNLFLNGIDSWRFLKGKIVPFEFENLELAKAEIEKGKPLVFVSIHLGAFEMLHRSLEFLIKEISKNSIDSQFSKTGVFRENAKPQINLITASLKHLDKYMVNLRATNNVVISEELPQTLSHKTRSSSEPTIKVVKDIEIPQTLKKIIRNNEIMAVMADQSKFGGENFQLLGQKIPLFLKLPLTANKLGATVILFRTFKKNDKHIIKFEQVFEPHAMKNNEQNIKNKIAEIFESWILENPEQWTWNYGFKSR
ncbi:hypothetical protein AGMMS49938_12190 [Fibrobacterales bacterium]|nr:hypothetical protein AGMMS49938_12190 [Fibrobacterales bacterium]